MTDITAIELLQAQVRACPAPASKAQHDTLTGYLDWCRGWDAQDNTDSYQVGYGLAETHHSAAHTLSATAHLLLELQGVMVFRGNVASADAEIAQYVNKTITDERFDDIPF